MNRAAYLALLLSSLTIGVTACGGEAGNAETPPDTARPASVLGPNDVAQAARADVISGVPVSGSLQPGVDVQIKAPVPEVVEQVLVREGDAVQKGQVLARFYSASLVPQAASAETQRRVAAADFERMKNLFAEGAVSQKDVENAELALRAAEAADANARRRLDEATVRAPVSGVIARRMVDAGDRVGDGDQLFQLVNTGVLEFEAAVPAQYVGDVRVGAPVVLAVTGLESAAINGRVSRVNATADPSTRQVKVYVTVPNADRRMVGGLFASGRIVLQERRGAVVIPRPGLRTDDAGQTYVLVIENDRIARRDVVAGVYDEVRVLYEITQGLAGGETVIIGPIEGLDVGDVVQLVGRES